MIVMRVSNPLFQEFERRRSKPESLRRSISANAMRKEPSPLDTNDKKIPNTVEILPIKIGTTRYHPQDKEAESPLLPSDYPHPRQTIGNSRI